MKISKKVEYALKALIELATDYENGKPVSLIHEIAKRKEIPRKYLEQVLLNLRNSGILVSKRGVGGGYSLSRAPREITLGETIRAVEGPHEPVQRLNLINLFDADESSYIIQSVMSEVEEALFGILDNISLEDITRRTIDLINQKNTIPNYAI